jgi:two-component system sensor histidine kinase BaeS
VKFAALLAIAVAVAIVTFEITMQPTASERGQLLVIFGAMAALTGVAAATLSRWTAHMRSLRLAVVVIGVAALVVVGIVTAVSAQLMFITAHDLTLIFIVVGFGIALGVLLATAVAEPMERDLMHIRRAVGRIGEGEFGAKTGVVRSDELGEAARAIDGMAEKLSAIQAERRSAENQRRDFLAAVGHDLRSPLAALRATVEALEDGLAPDPDRYLRSMRADLDALGHLVDDLFMLATIEAGKLDFERTRLDIAELADESLDALAPVAANRGVELRLDARGSVQVLGGSRELGRAIRNLVDNAIRHAPPGSVVVVRVENGDGALVSVTDEGPGFPVELVDSAFESFVTGDAARSRAAGGAGLGLAIARGVVAAHGGTIWAQAGPGGRVAFQLPHN